MEEEEAPMEISVLRVTNEPKRRDHFKAFFRLEFNVFDIGVEQCGSGFRESREYRYVQCWKSNKMDSRVY
jgi:hypothetical protein